MSNPYKLATVEDDEHEEGQHAHPESDGREEDGHHKDEQGNDDHDHHGKTVTPEEWAKDPTTYGMAYHLSTDHLIGHVQDQTFFEFPAFNFKDKVLVDIPNPLRKTNYDPFIKFSTDVVDEHGHAVKDEHGHTLQKENEFLGNCLLYTSPSPRDRTRSRMPSSA